MATTCCSAQRISVPMSVLSERNLPCVEIKVSPSLAKLLAMDERERRSPKFMLPLWEFYQVRAEMLQHADGPADVACSVCKRSLFRERYIASRCAHYCLDCAVYWAVIPTDTECYLRWCKWGTL